MKAVTNREPLLGSGEVRELCLDKDQKKKKGERERYHQFGARKRLCLEKHSCYSGSILHQHVQPLLQLHSFITNCLSYLATQHSFADLTPTLSGFSPSLCPYWEKVCSSGVLGAQDSCIVLFFKMFNECPLSLLVSINQCPSSLLY